MTAPDVPDLCAGCNDTGIVRDSDDAGPIVYRCDCPAGDTLPAERVHKATTAAYRPTVHRASAMDRRAIRDFTQAP